MCFRFEIDNRFLKVGIIVFNNFPVIEVELNSDKSFDELFSKTIELYGALFFYKNY